MKFATISSVVVAFSASALADVFSPPVTYPRAGTVWKVGEKHNVTWDTTNAPRSISNVGQIYLRKGNTTFTSNRLAYAFNLRAGRTEITVPSTLTAGSDYSILLYGDSNNFGQTFTINTRTNSTTPTNPTTPTNGTASFASYDTVYDQSSLSTKNIACSDGSNGIRNRGYTSIGQLPTYPYVGGAPTIGGYNSANCGKCYRVTYNGKSVFYTAIDKGDGFNMGLNALNKLTNNQARQLGTVRVTYAAVAAANCGF